MYNIENKISGIEYKISDLENVLPCYDIPSYSEEDELICRIIVQCAFLVLIDPGDWM